MYFRFVKMEETWYYMKGKSIWTYEYMIRDADYWHDSIKNKYNAGPSTSLNVKEEDDCENASVSNVNVKEEKVESFFHGRLPSPSEYLMDKVLVSASNRGSLSTGEILPS